MRQDTFHNIGIDDDLNSIFVTIDSKSWKRPRPLTLENLGGVLNIKIDGNLSDKNVTAVECVEQENDPGLPPNTYKISSKTHIAIDENYIYVWIDSLKRWKRALLSAWD